ncbi:MAG: cell division protein ZapA [Alphaproteobacteria bacterium]|nr:cell division protein ZapA [Alphaproteobacteria bacterium]
MGEVSLTINNRSFSVSCDDGQEGRLLDLARYVDGRLRSIGQGGGAVNESHLLVLTALVLADETFDLRESMEKLNGRASEQSGRLEEDELAIARAIEYLAERIESVADRVQKA